MAKELSTDDVALRSLKLMFEHGEVKRMYDIHKLTPTRIAKELKINHGRYIDKLANPGKFTINELRKFSKLIGVKPEIVFKLIDNELG